VAKRNTNASRVWMDLCALSITKGNVFKLELQDFPELRILELLGGLVSTDTNQGIIIRVNGHLKNTEGEDTFCFKEGKHD